MEKTKFVNKHKVRSGAKRNRLDKISQEFANNVRKKLGNHVKEIILFGSHARGDFTEGSDYDFESYINADIAQEDIKEAEKIINTCEEYLANIYKVSKNYWGE
ncbi:MAG TPA: nucleotidyltransferase domain-containing protein [Candidatus Brocadiaceae bacterium]|nr:nucleotidyltransferase domain-containing protein [Candidatus Brocadiaceae bacterium]